MKHRNINKHILVALLVLSLTVVCCACIVSCGGNDDETMYPEYTGGIWTLDFGSDDHDHETVDIDNIIDFGSFVTEGENVIVITGAVTTDDPATDVDADADHSAGNSSTTPEEDVETAPITHSPNHEFSEDVYDHSGYQTLKPVTTKVKN